jgi:hypothetical protein
LEYRNENGEMKVLEKIEPFHQLIVDVQPTIYEALDSYFNPHIVFTVDPG